MTTWKDATAAAAQRLDTLYRTPHIFDGNFWFGGNALHAFLESCLATRRPDDGGFLPFAFEKVYQPLSTPESGWWRDDYAWWGNAFCAALQNRKALGYEASSHDGLFDALFQAAASCWTQLEENWRDEPYGRATDNSFGQADITGGSFNDLNQQVMSGRNCVTNEGFWLLSLHLSALDSDPAYSARAAAESAWFAAWLEKKAPGTGILGANSLVLERPTGHRLLPGWFWAGDQGLFMAAFLKQQTRRWPPPYTDSLAATIATRVMTRMVDTVGVLHENLDFAEIFELKGFLADYATGKGVFIRNLGYLAETLGTDWRTAYCNDFIGRNAIAVWRHRNPETNQLPFNWNPGSGGEQPVLRVPGKSDPLCDLIMQACGLDALSLAARYLPGAEIV